MCEQHVDNMQQWGLSNELFVLGDSLVLTVLGQVSFMPVLVLAARLCPEVKHHFNAIHMCLHSLHFCCMVCSVTSLSCSANKPETSYASCVGHLGYMIYDISCCLHTSRALAVSAAAENKCDETVYLTQLQRSSSHCCTGS